MLEIYCDGFCCPNPGDGGWAFVVYRDGQEVHHEHGGLANTTNNVMELTGMLRALQWLRVPQNRTMTTIKCDSRYVVDGCNAWRKTWEKNGWRKARNGVKSPLRNVELWQEVARTIDEAPVLPVIIAWVKGHRGIVGNERADALAVVGAAGAAGLTPDAMDARRQEIEAGWHGERPYMKIGGEGLSPDGKIRYEFSTSTPSKGAD